MAAGYKRTMGWQSTLSSQEREMQLAGSRAKGRSAQKEEENSVHGAMADNMGLA
jgi:hypothetical protein